ncbi:unnamed protein product, partial [Effrenium voratum]
VDASGLEIGAHAVLCEDFDAAGPRLPGPAAGPRVCRGSGDAVGMRWGCGMSLARSAAKSQSLPLALD